MKILITGANGFIGKRVLYNLKERGIKTDDIIVLSSREIEGYNCVLHRNYSFGKDDITAEYIDCIIHIGGETPKSNKYDSPYFDNIRTTVHLVNNLPNIPSKIVFISTVSVYKHSSKKIDENSQLTTEDMYGLSKIYCEKYLSYYAMKNNVNLKIIRLGSVYGPGEERYDKIAGNFIKKAFKKENIIINSDGSEKRNMVYVDDVANCISEVALSNRYSVCQVVNLVNSQTITVRELAELVCKVTGNSLDLIKINNNSNSRNDSYQSIVAEKSLPELKYSYEDGVKSLYQYYLDNGVI